MNGSFEQGGAYPWIVRPYGNVAGKPDSWKWEAHNLQTGATERNGGEGFRNHAEATEWTQATMNAPVRARAGEGSFAAA